MNRLKELLELLRDKDAESKIVPEAVPYATRHGTEALVRNAKQAIPQIEAQYKEEVMNNVILIGVNGPQQAEFAKIAEEKYATVTVDYDLVINKLTERIQKRHDSRTYTTEDSFILIDELIKLKKEYNITKLPLPTSNGYQQGAFTGLSIIEGVRRLVNTNYRGGLQSAITRREIGDLALKQRFANKYLAVVLLNFDGQNGVDTNFLPQAVTCVETTKTPVTDKEVKSVLDGVSSKVRGKTSKMKGAQAQETTNE